MSDSGTRAAGMVLPGLLDIWESEPIGEEAFEDEVISEGENDAIFGDEGGRFLGLSLCEGVDVELVLFMVAR